MHDRSKTSLNQSPLHFNHAVFSANDVLEVAPKIRMLAIKT